MFRDVRGLSASDSVAATTSSTAVYIASFKLLFARVRDLKSVNGVSFGTPCDAVVWLRPVPLESGQNLAKVVTPPKLLLQKPQLAFSDSHVLYTPSADGTMVNMRERERDSSFINSYRVLNFILLPVQKSSINQHGTQKA
jgi:hypothetical protein